MSDRQVEFALIGCGGIAAQLADAIEAIEGATLVACTDINGDHSRAIAEEYDAKEWYTDHETLLTDAAPDVAIVATPNGTHADITVDCAEAGVHVLCQKPLEITVEALDRMVDSCEEHGVKLGGLYNLRLNDGSMATKHAVTSGALGNVVLANAVLPAYRGEEYYQGWHGSTALDGGCLFTQTCHAIDRLAWINDGIERVFADVDTIAHDIETEDVATVSVRYGNGARGTITATTAVKTYPHYDRLDIYGERGHIVSTDSAVLSFDSTEQDGLGYENPYDVSGFAVLIRDMVQAVIADREPMIPGREARQAPDAVLAMHESARREEPVDVGAFLESSRCD